METDSDDSDIPPPQPLLVDKGEKISRRFNRHLFKQQVTALDRISDWFANPEKTQKTAVIAMPTGSGKTGVICCLPYRLGADVASGKLVGVDLNKPILVIAPGIPILNQLHNELELTNNNTFLVQKHILRETELHAHYNVKRILTSNDIQQQALEKVEIVLVNAQKGQGRGARDIPTWNDLDWDLFSVVIVDEAHHLPAPQWSKIVERFKVHAKVVFFTATPYRSDKREITADINTDGLTYYLPRQEAIDSNIIRRTRLTCVPAELVTRYDGGQRRLEMAEMTLRSAKMMIDEKNRSQRLPGGKLHMAILAAYSIEEANVIADKWNESFPDDPPSAAPMHSGLKKEERKEIEMRLKSGQLKLIVIVQMLLEGFDHPPISIAVIATRIRSPVKFAQFIGRAQRVVRCDAGVEQRGVANIITHQYFEQNENYELFKSESLIPISEEEIEED